MAEKHDRVKVGKQLANVSCGTNEDCLFRSSDDVRSGLITGIDDFGVKRVEYNVIDDIAIFEGDIALGRAEEVEAESAALQQAVGDLPERARGIGITNGDFAGDIAHGLVIPGMRFRWPNGLVPWEVVPSTTRPDLRSVVTQAIAHWEQNTRIRFVERTTANAGQFANFVSFQALDGCWSHVGMQGGRQTISLGSGCGLGAAIHEIGHAVGLWHEQSREDRDRFVRIRWENIQAGREHNFNQHITDGDDIGNYDFGSIMHYPRTAFSRNGQPTIEPVNGQTIGQRDRLSAGDIAAVRAMYPQLEPSQSWAGTQFQGTVNAGQSGVWFTHSWPAYWYVAWTIAPLAPPIDGAQQLEWTIQSTRQTETLLKYFIVVRNVTNVPVSFEARYDVLGWSRAAR